MANTPLPTDRAALLQRLAEPVRYDLAVVGGGATGLGVALDAAQRGHRVLLVEAHDFAKGTSSRATKLVHGGVRYLAQGDIHLVREALHERVHILHSAPHLAQPLAFVMPSYKLGRRRSTVLASSCTTFWPAVPGWGAPNGWARARPSACCPACSRRA